MPQLKPEDMAEMRPITFKSRDGLTIHGYITLPKAALEGKSTVSCKSSWRPQESVIAGIQSGNAIICQSWLCYITG